MAKRRIRGLAKVIYRQMAKIPQNLHRAQERCELENLRQMLDAAKALSAGGLSAATQKEMGHPYAWGHPEGPGQDTAIINEQSGELYGGWRAEGPIRVGNRLRSRIWNETPYSVYFNKKGTKRMIPRPLAQRVREETVHDILERRREVLRHLFD